MLDELTDGKAPVTLVGDGTIATSCLRCTHDDEYAIKEVLNVQAVEDVAGARPPRTEISKSSRKPIEKSYPNAAVVFGVGYIEDRPKCAVIVARIITAWADIERACADLLAEIMGVSIPSAAAVFSSLRSSRAQHDALDAAAKISLTEKDYELFAAHMTRRSALEKERNDLAHGCFGVSVAIPEAIIWVSQPDYTLFQANIQHNSKAHADFRSKQFVYEAGTLERIAQEIEEFYNQLKFYRGYLQARRDPPRGEAFRAERYPQLCNQAHILRALEQLRTAKKARLAAQKGRNAKQR